MAANITTIEDRIIVCYLCTFEPRTNSRVICGCSGLITLLERAGMLAKLTW